MATYHLRVKDDTKRSGSKVSPKRHVDYILREEGQTHADYINREGAQSDCNDCVFKGSQLPKWAKGSAQKFFSAATRYEDKGNCRYKEIELSLPNELTLEQNREIVDRFLANHLANHYYAYAIHEKAGELSGERHPHVHIMFSERLIDDVEKTSERPACKYFRRAAKPLRDEQIASFERRCQHGAPKDKKWHSKKYFFEMREDFARIQNEVLEKNGYSIRVDHRTLNAQRVEAEKHGDDFLANVYKRVPESYIGIVPLHAEDRRVADVKRYREQKQSKQTSLFNADLKRKSTEEAETKFLVRQAEYASLALLNSQAYKSANLEDESLRALNRGILAGLERIKKLKRELVGVLRAHQRAQKEYLSATDHSFLIEYENKLRQRDNLQRLLSQLIPPPEKQTENRQAFHAIRRTEYCIGEQWTDADDAQLRTYLRENYAELKEKQLIEDYVIHYASKNAFNAVKDFLENMPSWDGIPRAENLFVKFLHAEDSDYTREVTMNWLFGAIARVYHPGCDYQTCLVLQGAQRIGKSRNVSMLGGKRGVNPNGQNWHVALKDSVDDAHAVDALQKGWIVEIEEFSAARRAEYNALKSFISAADDTRRFAYDRRATTRKRHVVFVVTCNDDQFLRDPTGNARFVIIKCSQKKFDRVEGMTPEYIRQVWAEVLVKYKELFKDGFDESKLQLKLETQIKAEEISENYLQDDGLTTEIKAFLDKKIPPLLIWHLLSKEERYRYRVDGGKIQIEQDDLDARFKNATGKRFNELKPQFDTACRAKDGVVRKFTDKNNKLQLVFYGSELREHICAAEIFNETLSKGDKRAAMYRINDILNNLEGWHVGKRLKRVDPEYQDQKKPYYRNR